MSLRRTEPRFALPLLPRRVIVLGGLEGWRPGLEQAGLETVEPGERADLVVAPAALAREAAALGAETIVLEGSRGAGTLRAANYTVRRLVCLPDRENPGLLLPAGEPAPSRYAIRHFRRGVSVPLRARNAIAAELLARGLVPPGRDVVDVASRVSRPPALLAEAMRLLDIAHAGWFIQCGVFAKAHSRAALYVFTPGSREPGWVVKFARIPGLAHIFDDDERGLRLAERLGPLLADHAPKLVGRFEVGDLHASVETAAVGERLATFLRSSRPRDQRLAALERLAAWSLDVARQTRAGPETLEHERTRLAEEVIPRWTGRPVPAGLVESLRAVPAVFEHDDLWADNIFFRDGRFVAVDWESAREHGPPLWDLLYLLTDGLAQLDHVSGETERDEYYVALCRGELASSTVLFRWLSRAVEALSVPVDSVGPLALLLWLEHAAVENQHNTDRRGPFGRLAERWLSEPGLGIDWPARG